MVAVIQAGRSLSRSFYYNENKVKENLALCLFVENYPMEMENLNILQKLNFLKKRTALNERTKINSVHISLNFHVKDQLNIALLKTIARDYMNQIGFGNQPYLVYQHFDAAHPHLHIVTTCIQSDGKRIPLHNLAVIKSEIARKNIEQTYNLIKALDTGKNQSNDLEPLDVLRVQYGKQPSKRAIQNVLDKVLLSFKYSNLFELNAILNQYNILADRGKETSFIYRNNGLLYCIIDNKGNRVGVPIKASNFYNKPTLRFLEERFVINEKDK